VLLGRPEIGSANSVRASNTPPAVALVAHLLDHGEIAKGTLRAAQELSNRLPEELAVTGWDDIPDADDCPQAMAELGTQAALLFAV
jgi:hypothetical protein